MAFMQHRIYNCRPHAKGKKVKLKFAAFPYQDFGIVDAKIVKVDPDATFDKEKGPLFSLRAEFEYMKSDDADINESAKTAKTTKDNIVKLKFGMLAEAEIVQRRKTIMSIILEPLRKLGEKIHP